MFLDQKIEVFKSAKKSTYRKAETVSEKNRFLIFWIEKNGFKSEK